MIKVVGSTSESMAIHDLGLGPLASCSLLLSIVVVVSRVVGLELEGRLIVSAVRCAVQLTLLCAFVLKPMFSKNLPVYVFPYLAAILLLAASEASSRLTYTYVGIRLHFLAAFAVGAGSVLAFAVVFVLRLSPWWDAQYLVPISGMALGNQLTATAIAVDSFLSELAEGTDRIQLRLSRGATWKEAVLPPLRKALTTGLTPTLNSMAVQGLVFLPGMLTGQLLGGQPPLEAGLYQVMIMYMVTVSGSIASCGTLTLAALTLFDTAEHALRPGKILKVDKKSGKKDDLLVTAIKSVAAAARWFASLCCGVRTRGYARVRDGESSELVALEEGERVLTTTNHATPTMGRRFYAVADDPTGAKRERESGAKIVLRADGVVVEQTRLQVSFALAANTITSLSGASGSGKSTTLRVLARIDARLAESGEITLCGDSTEKIDAPTWRTRVLYVSQDRPTLVGSPRDFYDSIRSYRSQIRRRADYQDGEPQQLAAKWGLKAEKFEQNWSTLSGGEAQRAQLAIALALKPDVLLLDEPTSALDDHATRLVEEDLVGCGAAILMATHSVDQASRLCKAYVSIHASREGARSAIFHP